MCVTGTLNNTWAIQGDDCLCTKREPGNYIHISKNQRLLLHNPNSVISSQKSTIAGHDHNICRSEAFQIRHHQHRVITYYLFLLNICSAVSNIH